MPNLTLNSLYSRTTAQSYVSTTDYSSTLFLEDAHIIAQDIWSDVVKIKKGFSNWTIWYADTVSLQDEYSKPLVSSTTVGADYIENISITYGSETYDETGNKEYIVCTPAKNSEIANWEYHLENQSADHPIYFERDKSVFIAPDPRSDEIGTDRIKITGIRSLDSGAWTTSTTEAETRLPVFFLEVIVLGCVWKANVRDKRDRSLVNDLKNEYIIEKQRAVAKLCEEKPTTFEYPETESEDIILR